MIGAAKKEPALTPLLELQQVWSEMRSPSNRLWSTRLKKKGCLTIEARKRFYCRVKSIHERAGVELISEKDRDLIFRMWEDKVYPRGYTGEEPTADTVDTHGNTSQTVMD